MVELAFEMQHLNPNEMYPYKEAFHPSVTLLVFATTLYTLYSLAKDQSIYRVEKEKNKGVHMEDTQPFRKLAPWGGRPLVLLLFNQTL
jgi:hypothetical protein